MGEQITVTLPAPTGADLHDAAWGPNRHEVHAFADADGDGSVFTLEGAQRHQAHGVATIDLGDEERAEATALGILAAVAWRRERRAELMASPVHRLSVLADYLTKYELDGLDQIQLSGSMVVITLHVPGGSAHGSDPAAEVQMLCAWADGLGVHEVAVQRYSSGTSSLSVRGSVQGIPVRVRANLVGVEVPEGVESLPLSQARDLAAPAPRSAPSFRYFVGPDERGVECGDCGAGLAGPRVECTAEAVEAWEKAHDCDAGRLSVEQAWIAAHEIAGAVSDVDA